MAISRLKSKSLYNHFLVDYAHRYINSRVQRLLGVPEREQMIAKDDIYNGYHLVMCPYSKVIMRFNRALGKHVNMIIPCGRCLYCRHKYQNQLIYRMYVHDKFYKKALFITLTYAPYAYSDDPAVARRDITLFLKRLRKHLNDPTFSYYMVCERGDERNRLHFHLILWWNGLSTCDYMLDCVRVSWSGPIRNFTGTLSDLLEYKDCLPARVPYGFVTCDARKEENQDMSSYIFSYVSKYVSGKEKKMVFRSWSLGLGADILATDDDLLSKFRYLNIIAYNPKDKVYHIGLPKYYKNKIFTLSERDCFFADYLLSDDYAKRWEFYNDSEKMRNLEQVYKDYEKRTLDAYKARKQKKKRNIYISNTIE